MRISAVVVMSGRRFVEKDVRDDYLLQVCSWQVHRHNNSLGSEMPKEVGAESMWKLLIIIAILAGPVPAGFSFGTSPAYAQSEQDEAKAARDRGNIIPYGTISRRIEQSFGGRVVGQRVREFSAGRWVYELRLLKNNGEVISVVVDAHTGEVLTSQGRR